MGQAVVHAQWHRTERPGTGDVMLVAFHLEGKVPSGFMFLRGWFVLLVVLEMDKPVFAFPRVVLLG
jgi:hypothetical protein